MNHEELSKCVKFEDFKRYMGKERQNFSNWTQEDAAFFNKYLEERIRDDDFNKKYNHWLEQSKKSKRAVVIGGEEEKSDINRVKAKLLKNKAQKNTQQSGQTKPRVTLEGTEEEMKQNKIALMKAKKKTYTI